ncbi:sodium channel protein Nach [Cardiocondyla obscurior]|uniref:sodium channel protein Nach n=1 Tax=Cardiocondyla obscurior TaxID=286306 RepID=UPI0039657BD7
MKKCLGWFYVFFENTSLHGFRYISIDGSSIIESAFWFVVRTHLRRSQEYTRIECIRQVCMSSIVFSLILMLRLWANYSNNPIVTTIYTSNPIWDVSFPGVTICNNNKVYRPHADLIAQYLYTNGFTVEESDRFFSSLMKLIRPDKISIDNVTASQLLDNLDMTVEALMKQLMQPCSAFLLRCAWVGKIHDCTKIFKPVKSKEGFCCAFNSHYDLNTKHVYVPRTWDFSRWSSTSTRILRNARDESAVLLQNAPGSGRDVGLAVALNIEPDTYKASSRPFVGASVMIHDPIDFPDIGAHVASVLPGHVLAISVTGTSIRGMESLRNIPLEKRLCYFDDEVKLRVSLCPAAFGKDMMDTEIRYSYQSCVSKCTAKYTFNMCGCLPFYYPEAHRGMRTCYLSDIDCLLSIRSKEIHIFARIIKSDIHSAKVGNCTQCLPQCIDMMYHISPENIKMDNVRFDSDLVHGFDVNNVSLVHVFFGDISYVEYRKESIISWDSLLASFGGIFGLCFGGSVMSVIELVYLLARQFFRKRTGKIQEESCAKLPPASEVFQSMPVKEVIQQQKLRDRQRTSDRQVLVAWYQPSFHRRKIMDLDDMYHIKHVKF